MKTDFVLFSSEAVEAIRLAAKHGLRPDARVCRPIGPVPAASIRVYHPATRRPCARCRACGEALTAGTIVVEAKAWATTVVRLHVECPAPVKTTPPKRSGKNARKPTGTWRLTGGVWWLGEQFYLEERAGPKWRAIDFKDDRLLGKRTGYTSVDAAKVAVESVVRARAIGLLRLLEPRPGAEPHHPYSGWITPC